MANTKYPKGLQKLLAGDIDFDADDIQVALIDDGAYYDAADEFFSVMSGNIVGTAVSLSGITLTLGVLDADDTVFTAVSGSTIGAIVIYKNTGSDATSPLIAWIDTSGGSPISLVPNGGDITVQWDNGTNKILKL